MASPVYALNLFNVADRAEYLAYSRRSSKEVQAHGGRVVALGKFREAVAGEIKPRSVLILVEWASKEAFDGYCNDPKIADLHRHREKGACAPGCVVSLSARELMNRTTAEVMTEAVVHVDPASPLTRVLQLMVSLKTRSFPVMSADGQLEGMISRADVMRALKETTQEC